MELTVSHGRVQDLKTPLLIVPILEDEPPLPFQPKDVKGEFKKTAVSYQGFRGIGKLLFTGLGKPKEVDRERVRKAMGIAVREARELEVESCAALFRRIPGIPDPEAAGAMAEGLLLGGYWFEKYKTKKEGAELKSCALIGQGKGLDRAVAEAAAVARAVNMVRDMINENADLMTTERIAAIAADIASKAGLSLKVLERADLEKLGMNLLLAVARGSRYPPKMIILEYHGNPRSRERIALVGKGITFDSGGINLKPTGYIETMKQDMSGAATVLGVAKAAAELRLRVNILAVAPVCENMIGPSSYKPGDVFTSYAGKTVEIDSTDAEGRLVLADAIAYTEKNLRPSLIIDIATLTGAAFVVLGEYVTCMMGTDKKSMQKLFGAGERTYDRVWELPLYDEYKEEIKGDIADLTNLGYNKGKGAGTIIGGAFLSSFVEKTPFVHLDIGNTAWRDKLRPGYLPKNATGAGVRLLVEFLRSVSR